MSRMQLYEFAAQETACNFMQVLSRGCIKRFIKYIRGGIGYYFNYIYGDGETFYDFM